MRILQKIHYISSERKISADACGVCIGHLKNKNSIYFLNKYDEK